MIIVMEPDATEEQKNRVLKYIEDRGMKSYIHKGDILNVMVINVDEKRGRIGLSLKQATNG